MVDLWNAWADPSVWIGGGGFIAGAAAIAKTILDSRKDSGKLRQDAEGDFRDDLREENRELRTEIRAMRTELAEARKEMNALAENALDRLRQCEERAARFQQELANLRGRVQDVIVAQKASNDAMDHLED